MLIILTGKTASGKDTIISALLKKYPNLKKIKTSTSRAHRFGENEQSDYYFINRSDFEKKIKADEFAEHVEYGGNLYGTEKRELTQALQGDALWKIDPSRAGEARDFIKRTYPKTIADNLCERLKVIYINAPDEEILQRLQKRGLTQEEIQKRMSDDKRIWTQYGQNYDFVVENTPGKLDETINKIIQIIQNDTA